MFQTDPEFFSWNVVQKIRNTAKQLVEMTRKWQMVQPQVQKEHRELVQGHKISWIDAACLLSPFIGHSQREIYHLLVDYVILEHLDSLALKL